jgi:hypothetical protein
MPAGFDYHLAFCPAGITDPGYNEAPTDEAPVSDVASASALVSVCVLVSASPLE